MSDEEPQRGTKVSPTDETVVTDGGEAWRSIQRLIELQTRLTEATEEVDDEEIRAEYGADLDPSMIRELFKNSTFGRRAKDQRASARGRLRRRLNDLAGALDAVERAIDDVFEAPGRTNDRAKLDQLKAEIERFRQDNKLCTYRVAEREFLPFEEMFAGEGAWTGPAREADMSDLPRPTSS